MEGLKARDRLSNHMTATREQPQVGAKKGHEFHLAEPRTSTLPVPY
jgi:hypothetical protein